MIWFSDLVSQGLHIWQSSAIPLCGVAFFAFPTSPFLVKFGPNRRVLKRPHFQAIQRLGRRVTTKHFVLIVARAPEGGPSRIGITASRKVGNAVVRNRMKRMIRAAFRQTEGLVPSGFELVVICKMAPPELTSGTVVQEWRGAKKRLEKTIRQLEAGAPAADRPKNP